MKNDTYHFRLAIPRRRREQILFEIRPVDGKDLPSVLLPRPYRQVLRIVSKPYHPGVQTHIQHDVPQLDRPVP
jgi:hypothetical protein